MLPLLVGSFLCWYCHTNGQKTSMKQELTSDSGVESIVGIPSGGVFS